MARARPLLCGLLLVVALALSSPASAAVVGRVEVTGDRLDDPTATVAALGLEVGRPIDPLRLREGLLTLFAGGRLDHLEVTATPDGDQLLVVVEVRLKPRVAAVEVVGPGLVWRRRVAAWLEIRPGEAVNAGRVEAGARRVLVRLRERGFSTATVEPEVDFDRATNTVAITLAVALGPRERLAAVRVEGLDEAEAATAAAAVKTGRRLTPTQVEEVRDQVERAVRELGYWDAAVAGVARQAAGPDVTLVVTVKPHARYRLQVEAAGGEREVVAAALPDPADGINPAQTAVLAERVRDHLQERGHLLAEVTADLDEQPVEPVLTVRARPGPLYDVADVVFPGADERLAAALAAVVRVDPGPTTGWRGRRVTRSSLDEDRLAVAVALAERGFSDARVGSPELRADGDEVVVAFPVDAGRRFVVTELRFVGMPVETMALVEGLDLDLAVGGPWVPARLEPLRHRLEAALAATGYPAGRVRLDTAADPAGTVALTVVAEAGPFVRFGDIVVSGLETTREAVVRDVLDRAGLTSGAPYSAAAVTDAQRRLYELGLFRSVEVVPIPGQERRPEQGLAVRLEEGEHRSVLFGIGWDSEEALRLTLGWGHLNVLGAAYAFSCETRFSDRELRFQASLRQPSLFASGIPGYTVLYRTEEQFASYSQQRSGMWFEIGDRRRRPTRSWLRAEYQLVEPDAPDEVLSELERQDQRIRLASLTPALELDTRDDPLTPRRGLLASASLEYAFPFLQAEAEFLKLQGSLSWYRSFRRAQVAVGLRLGAIEPLGAQEAGSPDNLAIPLATRFFSGGRTTHRAFSRDSLGIPGDTLDAEGNAIGGAATALLNLELLRPVWGPLAATLFVDGGNVWSSLARVDAGDVRWGAGLGVRYDTPAGPLRLEYGHKLDRQEGESSGELFLSYGVPF